MKEIILGNHIRKVPSVAVGCMRLSEKSKDEMNRFIHAALEQGAYLFDHADIYGDGMSESIFGEAFADDSSIKREDIYLQSKCGIRQGCYDLSKEFPAITLRKTYIKSAIDEILWIWQKKSNNVHDLKSHIWDSWADEDGSIGKAYGYQMGVKHQYKEGMFDQVDRLIYDLKHNPYSRRMMTNMYVHEDLHEMNLYPCAYGMTFNVTGDRLNAILNQRSQDVLAANNWNVVQYAALVYMIAQVTGFKPGELVHVIADAHIYDRHIPIVKELISRETYPAPKFTMNPDIKDFYQFTLDDFTIEDYQTGPQVKNIPIAV